MIHDCTIYVRANANNPNHGDDVIQWGSGISFYNNHVKIIFDSNYSLGSQSQHGDVFQIGGSYYKIYDNVFEDVAESIVYHDQFGSPVNARGLLFYNNLIVNSRQPGGVPGAGGAPRGLDFNPEQGGIGTNFTDFVVANNVFVDWTAEAGVSVGPLVEFRGMTLCTNCIVKNDIAKNCAGAGGFPSGGSIISSNNIVDTGNNIQFVNYSQYATATNDFHLVFNDTLAIDAGADLSSYFTTDKDGVTRPQGPAWDIGAYEYVPTSTNSSKCGAADTNSDGVVSIGELMSYISSWKNGNVNISDLMKAIGEWKNGC